jgi:hypothetical protein
MNWIQRNFKTIVYISFLIPIITVAVVSISHVTRWYGLSNPVSWAIYLSVGIEIAALSALAAITADMGKKVYFPFGVVTFIQFIGNIFFAYQFIDVNAETFKNWIELVDPLVSLFGVESNDIVGHKRALALFSGGLLPLISLSFLHMLVKFEEEEKNKKQSIEEPEPTEKTAKKKKKKSTNNENLILEYQEDLVSVDNYTSEYEPTIEELEENYSIINSNENDIVEVDELTPEPTPTLEELQRINEKKFETLVEPLEDKPSDSSQIKVLNYKKNNG